MATFSLEFALPAPFALAAALLAPLHASAQSRAPAPRSVIVATITGLRNDRGFVRLELYDRADRWTVPRAGVAYCRTPIRNHRAVCVLQPVRAGTSYAIAFAHDENDNGRVDMNFLHMPTEGYGFSNDVRPVLSAPSFERCRFTYRGGVMNVRMTTRY